MPQKKEQTNFDHLIRIIFWVQVKFAERNQQKYTPAEIPSAIYHFFLFSSSPT